MSEDNRLPRDREEPVSTDPGEAASTRTEPEEGPVRRPLIRATLKLPEGTPPTPREHPVFTMHQQQPSGNGRGGGNWSGRGGNQNGNQSRKKGAQAARGNGGGKKWASRGERGGSGRAVNGNRQPSGRGKGRAR